jgi:hypothetical protein
LANFNQRFIDCFKHVLSCIYRILTSALFLFALIPRQSMCQSIAYSAGIETNTSATKTEWEGKSIKTIHPESISPFNKKQAFLSEIQTTDQLNALIGESRSELTTSKGQQLGKKFNLTYRHFVDYLHITFPATPADEVLSLRNASSPFMKKAGRGALLIGGVELIGMVGLILMPREITKWEEDWIKAAGRNYKRAFTTAPTMDQDDWPINYIGHPVAGAYYYNAVRSQNATWWQSFLFSTAQSFIWEYVIEGCAEQPSIQDLIVTPIGGMALGEPAHLATMAMRRNGFKFIEKVVTFIINPMFVLNNGYRTPYSVKPRP